MHSKMLRVLGRSHTRLLSARSAALRVAPPLLAPPPSRRSFNSDGADPSAYPFSRNPAAMAAWRKTLNDGVLKSPFYPVKEPTETITATIFAAMERHEETHPDVPAMIDVTRTDSSMGYRELRQKARSLGGYLQSRGFEKNHKAAIAMPNCFEWPVSYLGVWAAGGTIVGTSSSFTPFEMEKQFLDCEATVVLTNDELLGAVLKSIENCPKVKTVICARTTNAAAALPEGVIDLAEATEHPPIDAITDLSIEEPALIFYSSGTTGVPKGTVVSHRAINSLTHMTPSHWEHEIFPCLDMDKIDWSQEHQVMNLPFYHIFGFGLLNWFFKTGSPMLVMDKFDPMAYLSAIQKYKPRFIFVVPPILVFLAKHPAVAKFDLSSLEMVICGAAPAGKDICEEFIRRFPDCKFLCQGYGMTEVGFSHFPFPFKRADASCGIVAALCEQKIIDPATGEPVALGTRGEICVRGSTLMTEYLNQPEATAATIDKEGWLHTGDIAEMDKEGRLYIVDRLKELIKVKGLQVAPAELEDLLLSHPLIADVAIIGVPDEKLGERVRAFIVRREKSLEGDEVRNYVAEKLSDHKHITGGVKFVKEIPKSPSGKILRRILRDKTAAATHNDEAEE